MVNTGDMVGSPKKNLWADFWEMSKPLMVPYFLTVGNHDVNDLKSEKLYKKEVDLPGNELYCLPRTVQLVDITCFIIPVHVFINSVSSGPKGEIFRLPEHVKISLPNAFGIEMTETKSYL